MKRTSISRRGILKGAATLGLVAATYALKPVALWAGTAADSSSPDVLTGASLSESANANPQAVGP